MAAAEKTVRTRYADIAVRQSAGSRLPLLMLHGSGASQAVFDRQFASPLAETHRLIAIDLPGHGRSSDAADPATAYTVPGFAAAAAAVLEALDIERAAVFGWSLGGHVAIEMLATNPAVAGIMITGTPPIGRGPIGALRGFHVGLDIMLASKEVFSPRDVERYARLCYGDSADAALMAAIERTDGRLRKLVFSGMMRGLGVDQKRAVEQAVAPVAVVNGEHEPIARLSYLSSLAYASLWEGQCHVVPGAGHAPFLTHPEAFNPLLTRFATDVALREIAGADRAAERLAHSA